MTMEKAVDAFVASVRLASEAAIGVALCKIGKHDRTVGCQLCDPDRGAMCGPCRRCSEGNIRP